MGKDLIAFYREKVKPAWKLAFWSVFLLGLLTHLYKFTNYLPDRDSLLNVYHDQNILSSGRWLLSLACGVGSYFDLPLVNGVLSLVYMGLTMVVLVQLFHMDNPVLILLSSGILVTFPGVTETFLYEYTADGYLLAMLLAALGAYLTRIESRAGKHWLLGGICLCACCGIYQAYVSFALVLSLCHCCQELLAGRDCKTCLHWALRQLLLYIAAMAVYYGIWKGLMAAQHVQANDYQGIANIGTNLIQTFLAGIPASIKVVVGFFLQWNVFKFGLTPYIVLNLLFLLLAAGTVVGAAIRGNLRGSRLLLYVLCLVLILPCSCIWVFVSQEVLYRPMMLLCLAVVYIFVLVLLERWATPRLSTLAALFMAVVVFHFALMANIGYHYLTQCYERTYAAGIQMAIDIAEMRENNDFTRIAVAGDAWLEKKLVAFDPQTQQQTPASSIGIFSQYMYQDLLFDHYRVTTFLTEYLGVDLEVAEWTTELTEMAAPVLSEMPVWPESGSLTVIDGTLILKIHG